MIKSLNVSLDNDKNEKNMSLSSKSKFMTHKGNMSFTATLFTYIKVNIVAGFLFLPLGFLNGGWLFSSLAIVMVAVLSIYCSISVAECSDVATSFSFPKIGYKAMGITGRYLIEYAIAISQVILLIKFRLVLLLHMLALSYKLLMRF